MALNDLEDHTILSPSGHDEPPTSAVKGGPSLAISHIIFACNTIRYNTRCYFNVRSKANNEMRASNSMILACQLYKATNIETPVSSY